MHIYIHTNTHLYVHTHTHIYICIRKIMKVFDVILLCLAKSLIL